MSDKTIAFIGGGNMATSLIGGMLAKGWSAGRIVAADPSPDARRNLESEYGIRTSGDNAEAADNADVVVLAVKPQVIGEVARGLADAVTRRGALVISIAAGVPVGALSGWLGGGAAIVRVMPNTPALIGEGASALYAGAGVSDEQRELARSIMDAASETVWVDDEEHMHAVTAISGSGPAYFFYLLESLIAAGQAAGLPEDLARRLVLKTGQGACAMALDSDESPGELRRRVTSPGGTTERALEILNRADCRDVIRQAVLGATERSRELGRKLEA